MNLRFVNNYRLENNRTAFQRDRNSDQWPDRNHWHKPDQFPRLEMGIDKLIAQSNLSMFHCQSLYVFSDSVLCLGKMGDNLVEAWKNKIKWYSENNHFKELNRIDGMQTEWEIFPDDNTTLGILEEIQKFMQGFQCEPEHFNDRIIFMSMFHDIAWGENGNTEECVQNS